MSSRMICTVNASGTAARQLDGWKTKGLLLLAIMGPIQEGCGTVMRTRWICGLLAAAICGGASLAAQTGSRLERGFARPPDSARPWIYWWWLDSNASKEGITRDLEEMKRQGIAGAMVFDAGEGHGTPVGPLFMSPAWRELFTHAVREAHRVGLRLSFNICSGWDCGGTWVTPEHASKRIVSSQTRVQGPTAYSQGLPQPPATNGYYRDVAVIGLRLVATNLPAQRPLAQLAQARENPQPLVNRVLDSRSAINLTGMIEPSGRLVWKVPEGDWLILRFGQTLYGGAEGRTKLASPGAQGYEIDFLSREALDRHFAETAGKVASDVKALAGETLRYFHDDSWESGEPNWTPAMLEEFQRRRGYDLLPYLPVLAGITVDNPDISTRILRDFRRTIADLMAENHYGRLRELSRRWNIGVHAESGGPFFVPNMDALMNLGRNDIPMGEYWIRQSEPSGNIWYADQYRTCDTVKQAASAAHVYGKELCQAEAFTNMGRNWEEDPFMLKAIGDRAFCAGLTRNMLCFYVQQPHPDIQPGFEWPEAGTHFDRNITWWNQIHAFLGYLSRCQFLLQQGRFVADVCYFAGEDVPCYVPAKTMMNPPLPSGYDCDTINAEVLLTRLSVRHGRLALPDGMSYRLLILPQRETMTPEVLKKITALVDAGATVAGPKPSRSPSLRDYPKCDEEVGRGADDLWGLGDGQGGAGHPHGKGRVIRGTNLQEILLAQGVLSDFEYRSGHHDANVDYIHRRVGQSEVYFVSNQADRREAVQCTFRVGGREPELWDAVTGEIRKAVVFSQTGNGTTSLPLELPPRGSIFVVFRNRIPPTRSRSGPGNSLALSPVLEIKGPWVVRFDPKWGGPESVEFAELVSWTKRPEEGIRHYSGTATYRRSFEWPESLRKSGQRWFLDLGEVKNLAEVRLNGQNLGVVWTKPFRVEITRAAKTGSNTLEIDVVNLWPNRLIGDQRLPEDKRFTRTNVRKFKMDTPLLDSGLQGPVTLQAMESPALGQP